ncbi:hypothetical protein B0H16DRAFT_157779 [Mycena metata]|uniref:Uncharacterized protein n=1 Tax=Mycena metata TaxID=1033252 RepID=A0AAD7MV17_9AGAR|nr:hypothetical protein B0H16DRAFT_157779 [Mycena metata]
MHLLWFIVVCAANSVLATQHNITVDDTNPSISYTGTGWHREAIGAELEGSLHTTCGRASEGSSATFSFTGVAIYYMFTPENCPPKTTLILDGGAPITVTYNPSLVRNGMSVQWGMTNLPNGPHTIVNTGDGADTFARVDAFIYTVDKPDGVSSPPASLSGGSPTSARVSGPEGSITAAKVGISPSGSSPTSPAGSSSTSLAGSSSTSLTGSSSTSSANSSPISDSSPTTRLSGLGGYSARATVGGVVGAVVVLIVLGIYYYLQAPTPAHGHSHEFMFLPPVPIVFRRRQLRDYEIIITLKPDNWDLVAEQPERGFTCKGSTRHDLVVWKAIQFG